MNTYIFYTDEGYTVSPNNEKLDNLQILGIEDGSTREEALANLYKNNAWIKTNGFSELRFRCYSILQPEILEEVKSVIQYLWESEEKHWEESGCPDKHIFQILKRSQNNV